MCKICARCAWKGLEKTPSKTSQQFSTCFRQKRAYNIVRNLMPRKQKETCFKHLAFWHQRHGAGKLNDSNIEARDSYMPENGPASLIHESMPGSLPGRYPTSKNMVLPDASLSKSMSKSAKIYLWHSEDVAEHCSTS